MRKVLNLILPLLLISCQGNDKKRQYFEESPSEIKTKSKSEKLVNPTKMAQSKIIYQDSAKGILGTISYLSGNAGGLEANLKRWARQLQISASDSVISKVFQQIKADDKVASKNSKLKTLVVNYQNVVESPQAASLIVWIVPQENGLGFVKFSGSAENLMQMESELRLKVQEIAWSDLYENP